MLDTTIVYNGNNACVQWSRKTTTKGLRHIQMRENRVHENVASKFATIHHINGKHNLADIFTKEMWDVAHFVKLRNLFVCPRLSLGGSSTC
jgi:hypothetical protein